MTTCEEINLYLFYEFGLDDEEDESLVSSDWPFVLQETEDPTIFRFSHEDETYYAAAGGALNFYPTAGMKIADLRLQQQGARWIGQRDPINLETSRIGYEGIPSLPERRTAIQRLITQYFGSVERMRTLEGLYLLREQQYLALVEDDTTGQAYVIGDAIPPQQVEFPEASIWRRLSVGIGRLIRDGVITEQSQ